MAKPIHLKMLQEPVAVSEAELEHHWNTMLNLFGSLPHPEHEPRRFAYYVRLYKYLLNKYGGNHG